MTEAQIIITLSDRLGAVVVPEPFLDNTDPELQWWRTWNRSRPALDLSKARNERDSYVKHAKKKAWWTP